MGTSAVVRKAGKTHAEALKNRTRIVLEIDKLFQDKRGLDPIGQQFEQDGGPEVDESFLIHRFYQIGMCNPFFDESEAEDYRLPKDFSVCVYPLERY